MDARDRLEVERENPHLAGELRVKVEQGVGHFRTWFLALLGLLLIPAGVLVYHLIFVGQRWQAADVSMFATDTTAPPPAVTAAEASQYAARRRERQRKKRK